MSKEQKSIYRSQKPPLQSISIVIWHFLSLQIRYRAFFIMDFIPKCLTGCIFLCKSICLTLQWQAAHASAGSIPVRPHNTSPREPHHCMGLHAPIRSVLLLRYITDHITLNVREGAEHWRTCSSLWPSLQIVQIYLVFYYLRTRSGKANN